MQKKQTYIAYQNSFTALSAIYSPKKAQQWQKVEQTAIASQAIELNVLLSANLVTMLSLTPPKNYQKYGEKLLLNLVERDIAEPIENIEIFAITQQKNQLTLAVINKDNWQSLQKLIKQHGWQLGNVWIDALCLPLQGKQSSLFSLNQHKVLWRSPNNEVFHGELSQLSQTLEFEKTPYHWLSPQPTDAVSEGAQQEQINQLLSWSQSAKHNLNAQTTVQSVGNKKPVLAILALSALSLYTANLALSNNHKKQLADDYYQASTDLFHQVLPQYKKIPTRSYLTQQLSNVINQAQSGNQINYLNWLNLLEESRDNDNIAILSVNYHQQPERMIITVEAENNEWIQKLQTNLEKHITVKQTQAKQTNRRIQATLEISR